MTIVLLLAGFIAVLLGAEGFVRGSSAAARRLGVSPLVVGLTVVAYGTSAPELAVSARSALTGEAGLAVANVAGSNIFNILAILGLSAVVAPLVVHQQLVRLDVPLLIAASLAVLWIARDGHIARAEGLLLCVGAIAYTAAVLRWSRSEGPATESECAEAFGGPRGGSRRRWVRSGLAIAGGLVLLVVGARWLVAGSVSAAEALGIPPTIIGLTVVAVGTSLPELATSIVASLRGERDIAAGNVIGSCIFNLLFVLGVAALLSPGGIAVPPGVAAFDLPLAAVAAVACLPIFFTGHRIDRWEGFVFLGAFGAYIVDVILSALGHPWLHTFRFALIVFALPLFALTGAIYVSRVRSSRVATRV